MENENEIKVEYEETHQSDPLSEPCNLVEPESEPCARAEMEESLGLRVTDMERKLPLPEVNAESDQSNSSEPVQKQEEVTDIHEDAATWYKALDSFGKYICNFCDRTYTVLTSLRYHVNAKHPEEVAPMKNKILNRRRKSQPSCHLCKKKFNSLVDLKSHVQNSHSRENVGNSCHYCNASFSNTQETIEHLKCCHNVLHNKLHICYTCGYRTSKLSHFKQHSDTHSIEKLNKCVYCDYATNHKSNLKNHERIHTKIKPFLCDFEGCGSKFTDMTALNYHVQKHYPEKNMLHCDKCSYKTVYKQSLKVHIESHMRR